MCLRADGNGVVSIPRRGNEDNRPLVTCVWCDLVSIPRRGNEDIDANLACLRKEAYSAILSGGSSPQLNRGLTRSTGAS